MVDTRSGETSASRKIGKSIGALVAGFVVNVVLSLGTDMGLHAAGVMPALSQRWSDPQLLIAATYRTLYAVFTSYLVARLAPRRPLAHAMIGGAIGLALSAAAAVATWNQDMGPHWYTLSLVAGALPTAWLGGTLRVMQMRRNAG
jgi:hypothetical protein